MGEIKSESALAAERMKRYILKHLHEAIMAKDVAAAAGYSRYHVARVFKGEAGVSPFEYILREPYAAPGREQSAGSRTGLRY